MVIKRFVYIISSILTVLAISFYLSCRLKNEPEYNSRQWLTMGTVAVYNSYSGAVDAEAEIVRKAFDEVSRELNLFSASSALSQLNDKRELVISAEQSANTNLLSVLSLALRVSQLTDGAFDPTINPLMRLWGFRKGTGVPQIPSDEALQKALSRVGYQHISISTNLDSSITIRLVKEGLELDLGGIAKGYAVDLAYERLVKSGATNFLINLGGNIRVCGTPSKNRTLWSIAIRDPYNPDRTTGEVVNLASGEAVATSGSYERFVIIDGKRYSHIIDPRNGLPVERTDSVTVIAPTAVIADAFSTARFVNGEESARMDLTER